MTERKTDSLAKRLGASRVQKLGEKPRKSPLGLLHLQSEISNRLQSSGGRPTDPSWTVTRQVPFRSETWEELKNAAEELGDQRRRVGPAQVAAILVEQGLGRSHSREWDSILEASRALSLLGAPDAADAAGVTYSQLDQWAHSGRINVTKRVGRIRKFDADEVVRARVLRRFAQLGFPVSGIAPQLRELDLSVRFVVARFDEDLPRVETTASLHGVTDEATVVIDQEPIRRSLLVRHSLGGSSVTTKEEAGEREIRRAAAV